MTSPRILVISDLHLEFRNPWVMPHKLPEFDIAVFAGDMDQPPRSALAWMNNQRWLDGKSVLYVLGNHEFYHGVIDERLADAHAIAPMLGIELLDRRSVVVDGVRFLGCTLWTDYELGGRRAEAMVVARGKDGINDHELIRIRVGKSGRTARFRPKDALEMHRRDRAWLAANLAMPHDGPTVVVTHHCPHPNSIAPAYADDPSNPCYASDLSELIDRFQPELWIHGHTHHTFDYRIGRTRVLCNPKGYGPDVAGMPPENDAFDPFLVVQAGTPTSEAPPARDAA